MNQRILVAASLVIGVSLGAVAPPLLAQSGGSGNAGWEMACDRVQAARPRAFDDELRAVLDRRGRAGYELVDLEGPVVCSKRPRR